MKLNPCSIKILCLSSLLFSFSAMAVTPAEDEMEKDCKKPKFRDFAPVQLTEVAPGAPISFHISRGADPHSVITQVKGQKVEVSVKNKTTFLLATANVPADMEEGFARVHVAARAEDGNCLGQDGWLLKIKSANSANTQPTTENKP